MAESNARLRKEAQPHLWFAWRPVRLTCGRVAWLQNVIRTRHHYFDRDSGNWRPTEGVSYEAPVKVVIE